VRDEVTGGGDVVVAFEVSAKGDSTGVVGEVKKISSSVSLGSGSNGDSDEVSKEVVSKTAGDSVSSKGVIGKSSISKGLRFSCVSRSFSGKRVSSL
jgi:hypothetical protein